MTPHPQTIIFDWNGTLLDDAADVLRCVNIVLEKINHPPISYEILSDAHNNWPPKAKEYSGTKVDQWPTRGFYSDLGVSEEGLALLEPIERNLFHDHYNAMGEHSPLRPGVPKLLNEFHESGIYSVILSNHLRDEIRKQLKRLQIDQYFAEILAFTNRETQFKDIPKGERLRRYMAEEKFDPKNTIIVGDTFEEIFIARDLGLTSVAISGGIVSEKNLRRANPDHFIHHLDELKLIVRQKVAA